MCRSLLLTTAFISSMSSFAQSGTFTLHAPELGGQATLQEVFNGMGCSGKNLSPALSWTNAPEGTKSFAITLYDPDAPTGSGWWHWVVFDIPATTKELPMGVGTPKQGVLPVGAVQSMTDFGAPGYGGPCPPIGHGLHTYTLTVHALDVEKLGLDQTATAPMVGFNLSMHTLGKATLVFYYER
ncbi:MAG: YbhB/YbcL family Raf kinase inhibitor-like protein [Flavobacteriales bacterium]|nr:YbhB/YbcL family Raf kinase inhibitor-like protein [Flavobacteriales bacterium]